MKINIPDGMTTMLLRYGFALVFIWFAGQQFGNPERWFSFLPEFTTSLPMSQTAFVMLNAVFETVGAFMLAAGLWYRPAAALLGLHLLGIAVTAGGAVGVRDFGLAIACIALAFAAPDPYTVESIQASEKK